MAASLITFFLPYTISQQLLRIFVSFSYRLLALTCYFKAFVWHFRTMGRLAVYMCRLQHSNTYIYIYTFMPCVRVCVCISVWNNKKQLINIKSCLSSRRAVVVARIKYWRLRLFSAHFRNFTARLASFPFQNQFRLAILTREMCFVCKLFCNFYIRSSKTVAWLAIVFSPIFSSNI